MSRLALSSVIGSSLAGLTLVLPGSALASPPVGECPTSFRAASLMETPESFWSAAAQIDKNDDQVVCLKPMAGATRTNVIDNIAHP